MRARSQARITAQGGTPATPAVRPTTPAPSTTGATTTPTAKPAATKPAATKPVATKPVDPQNKRPINNGDPMERMTGKGAASLLETYSKVYEEREPQAIDEGIMGALAKVGEVVAEEKTAADPGMKARMGKEAPKKGGYKLPERTPANAKNVEYYKDDADLFDIIKGHFIEEGLTEEEALTKMLDLTDEERTEIIESMASANRMKELKKERLSNPAPSVKYPAKPAPYGGARSREFENRLPEPQGSRGPEFEHGSGQGPYNTSGGPNATVIKNPKNLSRNTGKYPRDSKGNIMR